MRNSAGVTLSGCTFTGNTADYTGGALHLAEADRLEISDDCLFQGNTSQSWSGGALHLLNVTDVAISSASFTGNTAPLGGAINSIVEDIPARSGHFEITGSNFEGNHALAGNGGALVAGDSKSIRVSGTSFTGNTASYSCGAVYIRNMEQAQFTNTTFTSNHAKGEDGLGMGGGLYISKIKGVTIAGGGFTGNTAVAEGGGLRVSNGSIAGSTLLMDTVTFDTNTTATYGGGAAIVSSKATIENSEFAHNTAVEYGAALRLTVADTAIDGTGFLHNRATGPASLGHGAGGAIYATGITNRLAITGGTFENNTANYWGGALFLHGTGALAINETVFKSNTSVSGAGGAVYNNSLNAVFMEDVTFDGNGAVQGAGFFSAVAGATITLADIKANSNVATARGGAFDITNYASLKIAASSFTGNSAPGAGAVYAHAVPGSFVLESTSLTGNTALTGGAIYMGDGSALNITGSTFKQNRATGSHDDDEGWGGAIYTANHSGLQITNTVFAQNKAPTAQLMQSSHALAATHGTNILGVTHSLQGETEYVYNNYDVSFKADAPSGVYYTLTYDPAGGTGETKTFLVSAEGEKLKTAAALGFTSTTHNMAGWNTAPDGSGIAYPQEGQLIPTGDTILYAQWESKVYYTVAFDAAGGSPAPSSITVESGQTINRPGKAPGRDGYTFKNWYTTKTGGIPYDFSTPVTQSLTLYAQWTVDESTTDKSEPSGGGTTSEDTTTSGEDTGGGGATENTTTSTLTTTSRASSSSTSVVSSSSTSTSRPSSSHVPGQGIEETRSTSQPGGNGNGGAGGGEAEVANGALPPTQYTYDVPIDTRPDSPDFIEDNGSIRILGNEIPLGGLVSLGGWGLINLVLALLGMVLGGYMLARQLVLRKKGRASDTGEEHSTAEYEYSSKEYNKPYHRRGRIAGWMAVGLSALPVLTFLLLENFSRMILVTRWTPLLAVLLAVQLAVAVYSLLNTRMRGGKNAGPVA